MVHETEGLTGIDALEAEMRDRLAAKNAEIDGREATINDLLKERGELTNELAMLKAERDGLASMLESVQADSIMAAKEIDFFRRDRDTWERRFNDLLKAHVEVAKLLPPQPMVVRSPMDPLGPPILGLTPDQANVAKGLSAMAQREMAGIDNPKREYPWTRLYSDGTKELVYADGRVVPVEGPQKGQPANVRSQGFHAHVEASTAADRRCVHPDCQCAMYGECQRAGGPIPE